MTLNFTNTPRPPDGIYLADQKEIIPTISDNADCSSGANAFEGPEKLLEIWFTPNSDHLPSDAPINGLRSVERSTWEDMLKLVKCQILSVLQETDVDAFLLSESSMFVFPHKLILKTCGRTTLLFGVQRILEIAQKCNLRRVWRVFYSRKTFMFPEKQLHPHRTWDEEISMLNQYFENGASYTVGPTNSDHWLLYITSPSDDVLLSPFFTHDTELTYKPLSPPDSPPSIPRIINVSPLPPTVAQQDETIEILMTHLDPSAIAPFFLSEKSGPSAHSGGEKVTSIKGIDQLFPIASIDSYLFEPCGYSANGVVAGGNYFTIHVTPEPEASYASFESNVPLVKSRQNIIESATATRNLISKVLDIFRPGKFSITLFVSVVDEEETERGTMEKSLDVDSPTKRDLLSHHHREWVDHIGRGLTGYKRKDRIVYEFDGYDLMFGCFEKV